MNLEPWTEDDSTRLTVALIVRDGHWMRVRGVDRIAVVRAMAEQGHGLDETARRTYSDVAEIDRIRRRLGIELVRRPFARVPA